MALIQVFWKKGLFGYQMTRIIVLILNSVSYINDTTLTIIIRAGGIHNNLTFSPYHLAAKKLSSPSLNIIGPSGSNFDVNTEFIYDDDVQF